MTYRLPKSYWTTLKNRLKVEWSEVVTNCDQLKMLAQDGKMRLTDVADVETILRLVQYIKKIWKSSYLDWQSGGMWYKEI